MTDTLTLLPDLETLHHWRQDVDARGLRLGLVPTMGNLHAGHLSLVAAARAACDVVLATLFVNPLQFGPNEDLARYPRSFDADCAALQAAGCNALFVPEAAALYPRGLQAQTRISVPALSALHCGQSRPGHFDGVCTVVAKLFNLTRPHDAYFGLKDYQQFRILTTMVEDLNLPIRLHGQPIVREADGLAMSSRNGYLSSEERALAPQLYASLQALANRIQAGENNFRQLETETAAALQTQGLRPDYLHLCRQDDLQPAQSSDEPLIILAAAYLGSTRLIDNLVV